MLLNFDPGRFLVIQRGAVAQADGIDRAISDLVACGAPNVHFLGAGGAAILMQPAVQLLRRHSTLPVFSDNMAELMAGGPSNLRQGSIVVLPSLSGTTSETVAFLEHAKRAGATVVALVGGADTPVARGATHAFVNAAADDTSSESFYIQSLCVAVSIMKARGEGDDLGTFRAELAAAPEALLAVKRAYEPEAERVARALAGSDWHIFTGAGAAWPEAFYFAMCILEEMQWIRTRPVHASDFFHGTLELVEPGVSVVLLKGEDEARPLAERVEAFVPRVGGVLTVVDTAGLPTPGLSQATRALLAPPLLATALERVAAHLEVLRDHPLTTRRYYRRVDY